MHVETYETSSKWTLFFNVRFIAMFITAVCVFFLIQQVCSCYYLLLLLSATVKPNFLFWACDFTHYFISWRNLKNGLVKSKEIQCFLDTYGNRDGTVVWSFASQQHGLASIPAWSHIWIEFVVGSCLDPRVFLSPKEPTSPNSNLTRIERPHENQLRLMWLPL